MKAIASVCTLTLSLFTAAASAVPTSAVHHEARIEGHGAPTVVLESGLGDTLAVWKDIQPRISADCTRTVAYTRAGYLGSDPANDGPRDAATIVSELRQELAQRNITPPYVLVGHSLGGLYMQYFARNYPKEVSGLVLVDSTHWNQNLRIDASANQLYKRGREVTLFMPWIMRREFTDSVNAGEQVHDSPPAEHVRAIVLSSTLAPKGETPALRARAAQLQNDIVADFPGAEHVRVSGAGHYIQRDRPEAVIAAARELAGCGPGNPATAVHATTATH